ncbi:unnamed protein product [Ranitomeya imitator]|uniref:Uncharacterized protein n=1 Tax=Ranitomeya imitator TaxID=111125 RepID=A0ABN9M479_9NEOB|nr:unnamed protein product [Ranitomeya imitator]
MLKRAQTRAKTRVFCDACVVFDENRTHRKCNLLHFLASDASRNSSLPDESNVALLQEELLSLRKRESHALQVMREGQKQVTELSDRWQSLSSQGGGGGIWKDSPRKSATGDLQDEVMSCRLREVMAQSETRELRQRVLILESQEVLHEKQLSRLEKECKELRERLQSEAAQYKALQSQMSEDKRRHAVTQCKNKEEVMAVRLREADSMAAVAEMRQRIAELEIQKEEGVIKGKLNDSDSSQYIRELKDQIEELRQEASCYLENRSTVVTPSFETDTNFGFHSLQLQCF